MKAILLLILIGLGAVTLWSVTQNGNLKSTLASTELEKSTAKAELAIAEEEISDLRKRLTAESAKVARMLEASTSTVVAADPAIESLAPAKALPSPVASDPERTLSGEQKRAELDSRLASLAKIREEHSARYASKLASLESDLKGYQRAVQAVQDDKPTFSEQGVRTNALGMPIGNKGVRTSDADRAKATGIWQGQVSAASARVKAVEVQIEKVRNEREAMEAAYEKAVREARN